MSGFTLSSLSIAWLGQHVVGFGHEADRSDGPDEVHAQVSITDHCLPDPSPLLQILGRVQAVRFLLTSTYGIGSFASWI